MAALIQKLRNENGEQAVALFDVSLAVEKIDGGTSGTLQNLAPRIKRLGDRLAHAEREAPPTVAESEGFLAVAHDPGMWSQAADEFFVRKRIYRDHCLTPWVGILWRHGPGVSNLTVPKSVDDENVKLAQAQGVKASAKSMAEQIDNELIAELKSTAAVAACAYDSWSVADDACRAAAGHVVQRLIDQRRYRHEKRGDVRRHREVVFDLSSIAKHDPGQFMHDHIEPLADCIHNDLVDSGEPFEFVLLPSHEPIGGDQHDPLAAHVVTEDGYCVRARVARDSGGKTRMVIDWAGY